MTREIAVVGRRHRNCAQCHNTCKQTGALHFHILQKNQFYISENKQKNLKTSVNKKAEVTSTYI